MTDQDLMAKIKTEAGATIETVASNSSVPPAFLAGLIANESGKEFAQGGIDGACHATRFEKGVLVALWEVLLGRKANYGSIQRPAVVGFVANVSPSPATAPAKLPADALQRLDRLATSWSLTQVMGYHVLENGSGLDDPLDLAYPARCLRETVRLLAEFAHRFQLDLASEFPPLFTCWNTGSPTGKTFDPDYVANGMKRMELYAGLGN